MENCLIRIINELSKLGFHHHVYLIEQGFACNGQLLHKSVHQLHHWYYDEYDLPIFVYKVVCETLGVSGVAVTNYAL